MSWVWVLFSKPYLDLPDELWIWVVWLVWVLMLLVLIFRARLPSISINSPKLYVLVLLVFSIPFSFLPALKISGFRFMEPPGVGMIPGNGLLLILTAIPWMLVAALYGSSLGALFAGVVGGFTAFFCTHNIFSVVSLASLGYLFGFFVNQTFSDKVFRYLRQPLFASILLGGITAPLLIITTLMSVDGPPGVRFDAALTQSYPLIILRCLEVFVGGLVVQLLITVNSKKFQKPEESVPSPAQKSMITRFYWINVPMIFILLVVLVIAVWVITSRAVVKSLRGQMESTARLSAESMPNFLDTGQNLLLSYAYDVAFWQDGMPLEDYLAEVIRSVPFFRSLILLDLNGIPFATYPPGEIDRLPLSREELAGIRMAANGELIQSYPLPPSPQALASEVSFITPVWNDDQAPMGVIIGRSDMNANPFTQPAIEALKSFREQGGSGLILDEYGRILFYPDPEHSLGLNASDLPQEEGFSIITASSGEKLFTYLQTVEDRSWNVILTIPATTAQTSVFQIASPTIYILSIFAIFSMITLTFTLFGVKHSLRRLSVEAERLASGNLDRSLTIPEVNEVGQLGMAFETMRINLKQRLDEMNRLLVANQGLTATLDLEKVIMPVLKAALGSGANMARAVILDRTSENESPGEKVVFGIGKDARTYAYLDEQIFELVQSVNMLVIPLAVDFRKLRFSVHRPASLIAVAIHAEGEFIGALWTAYQQVHNFSDGEQNFLATLAGQASLAITNVRLFQSAEIGRQRLLAVINSSPDPILVFDEQDHLFLMNEAAMQADGLIRSSSPGVPVEEVVIYLELLDLIRRDVDEGTMSQEIILPSRRSYYASIKRVTIDRQRFGKVCVLREVTQYKEIDAMKSEFVSTVSHELRAPLQLMSGYATMLQMVGELNENQKPYNAKILASVEHMKVLIDHILDLERIDSGVDLKLEPIAVNDLIQQCIRAIFPHAAQKKIQINYELVDVSWTVHVDHALFSQALINLLDNGIRYSQMGGAIQVDAAADAAYLRITVKDNGLGIAPIDLPHLFERNYRSSKREAPNRSKAGLGLAIVHSIIQRHNGEISVESLLGKGSSFIIRIPWNQQADTASPEASPRSPRIGLD